MRGSGGEGRSFEDSLCFLRRRLFVFSLPLLCLVLFLGFGKLASGAEVIRVTSYEAFGKAASSVPKEDHRVKDLSNFASSRLIVKTSGSMDFSSYEPDTVIDGPENHYFLHFPSREAASKAYEELLTRQGVVYVEPDALARTAQASTSVSPKHYSWGVAEMGVGHFAQYLALRNLGSITVAVLDSGMDSVGTDHPLLRGKKLSGYNFVDNNTDTTDLNGHGTHVAGIVADCMQGLDLFLLPVRVMNSGGYGYEMDVASGVRYAADHGAKVINMSLECEGSCHYVREAILYALRKGISVVVAAGNNNWDVANEGIANISNAIVVGAVDYNRMLAPFSNYGATIDVVAPGVDIKSAYKTPERWMTLSGTSMATPHVSAVVAMYRLAYPGKKPAEIESLLKANVKDLGAAGWDPHFGAGIPNLLPLCNVSDGVGSQISLSTSSLQMKVGTYFTVKAEVYPLGSTGTLHWRSSNISVASVSNGKISAKKVGKAVIEVSLSTGASAKCQVTVKDASVSATSVNLDKGQLRLQVGGKQRLSATVLPDSAADKSLTWTSSNTQVATVNAGEVTAKGTGYALIEAKTENGKKAVCHVLVVNENASMGAVTLITGSRHTMAVDDKGILWGWGAGSDGQLGNGSYLNLTRPVPLLYNVKSVSCNGSGTVAVTKDATLFGTGRLSCLDKNLSLFEPLLTGVRGAVLGEDFLAVIRTNGELCLYGLPRAGSVGADTAMSPTNPLLISKSVKQMSASYHHMGFVKSNGKAWVFGNGDDGQLGKGSRRTSPLPGEKVLTKVKKVATGYTHTLLLRTDGTLYACGDNKKGQLGDGTKVTRLKPVKVASNVKDVCCGYMHTLILKKDGTVWAAGYGAYGQLGNGGSSDAAKFVKVAEGAAHIGAGNYTSFYVTKAGAAYACGDGTKGALGNGQSQILRKFSAVKR
ncbi:MAG: S8 family serine peptidase [Blautia sp.]|nr:S8 family serine peptidase [Blautia sp.]